MFHNNHLLPTDELATAIMLARVSIRPTERTQALKAKSAFMSSAHCVGFLFQLLLPLEAGHCWRLVGYGVRRPCLCDDLC